MNHSQGVVQGCHVFDQKDVVIASFSAIFPMINLMNRGVSHSTDSGRFNFFRLHSGCKVNSWSWWSKLVSNHPHDLTNIFRIIRECEGIKRTKAIFVSGRTQSQGESHRPLNRLGRTHLSFTPIHPFVSSEHCWQRRPPPRLFVKTLMSMNNLFLYRWKKEAKTPKSQEVCEWDVKEIKREKESAKERERERKRERYLPLPPYNTLSIFFNFFTKRKISFWRRTSG